MNYYISKFGSDIASFDRIRPAKKSNKLRSNWLKFQFHRSRISYLRDRGALSWWLPQITRQPPAARTCSDRVAL